MKMKNKNDEALVNVFLNVFQSAHGRSKILKRGGQIREFGPCSDGGPEDKPSEHLTFWCGAPVEAEQFLPRDAAMLARSWES